jgi:hypothetical protein
VDVIKKLMQSKILANINQVIDFGTAEIVADEFGYTVEPIASEDLIATESGQPLYQKVAFRTIAELAVWVRGHSTQVPG